MSKNNFQFVLHLFFWMILWFEKLITHPILTHPSLTSSQNVAHSYTLQSSPIQTSFSSRTRSTSVSTSAFLRQQAQPDSSTSENLPSSLSNNSIQRRPSSGVGTSFTVHSNTKSTHLLGDQESVSSLSGINTVDLPNHTLEENSGPPILDLYHWKSSIYSFWTRSEISFSSCK